MAKWINFNLYGIIAAVAALVLIPIIILGGYLRLINLSPFKFYPDAYQNLIVAHNISSYHSVFGRLGDLGMIYPYYLMWTRPGFPLVINFFNLFTHNPVFAAQLVSFLSGILAIPLAFLFIRKLFSSTLAGLIASLLLAISFNHIVWGGFIYTETLGVCLMLLLLWQLISNLENKSAWADSKDILIGFTLGLAVFTRYEYLILILPLSSLITLKNPSPLKKLINICSSFLLLALVFLTQLYPLQDLYGLIVSQLYKLLNLTLAFTSGFVLLLLLLKLHLINKDKFKYIHFIFIAFIWIIAGVIFFQVIFKSLIPFYTPLSGTRNFFENDLLLGLLSLVGLTSMLKNSAEKILGSFVLISMILLYFFYFNINPQMQRYLTHLLPFLLIPASYTAWKFFTLISSKIKFKIILILFGGGMLLWQGILSTQGIKNWDQGTWFRTSYEEKSAQIINQKLDNHSMIISALPEAYYFFTHHSTQSILENDQFPFLDIDNSLNNQNVYIIEDMGMTDLFPHFSSFLNSYLGSYKVDEYWVKEIYHFSIRSKEESRPVIVYKTTIGELKQQINQHRSALNRPIEK